MRRGDKHERSGTFLPTRFREFGSSYVLGESFEFNALSEPLRRIIKLIIVTTSGYFYLNPVDSGY